jgi:tetraacyldisaccharide 4'-kinase
VTRAQVDPGPLARALLAPPGLVYGGLVRLRNGLYDRGLLRAQRVPCPVVALGNLTVGGTGKTPLTSFVAAALADAGYRVGIVSRGYGRAGGRAPLLVSDGRQVLADAARAGDEPWLMARDNPAAAVAVGADRVAAARLLLAAVPREVLLLDDAFQHRRLHRDLDLLLVPAHEPFGNGRILPFGPLREPLSGVARADAIVVTRGDGRCPSPLQAILERHNPHVPVFHASLTPARFVPARGEPVDPPALKGFAAFAFSGIARPERFEADLAAAGVRVAGARRFADHHPYRAGDLDSIAAAARACGAEVLVTTEKDMVRIPAMPPVAPPLYALALSVSFAGDGDLVGFILDRLRREGAAGPARTTGAPGARR